MAEEKENAPLGPPAALPRIALCLLGLVLGCSPPTDDSGLPPGPSIVGVTMVDFRFESLRLSEGPLPQGRIVFRAKNEGTVDHELILVALPKDYPPTIQEQLQAPERRSVPAVMRLRPKPPGGKGTFAVDLIPGRYGLVCFVDAPADRPEGSGPSHAHLGMTREFRVV